MRAHKRIIWLLIIAGIATGICFLVPHAFTEPASGGSAVVVSVVPEKAMPVASAMPPIATSRVILRAGEASYSTDISKAESVAALMQSLSSSTAFRFTATTYPSLGLFIESINGMRNADGKYWMLYINGTSSPVGASSATVHPGDVVEWKYE